LLAFLVPNYVSEVYGEGSICVEVNATQGDCLPWGGTPRCYERQVVQKATTDQLAFSINVGGKEALSISTKYILASGGSRGDFHETSFKELFVFSTLATLFLDNCHLIYPETEHSFAKTLGKK